MTNVSKIHLKKTISDKILAQFSVLLTDFSNLNSSSSFITEFFSKSETLMVTKRLAIIFMVLEEVPYIDIIDILKVSPSTVNKIANIIDKGGYQTLKSYFKNKKNKKKFWYSLEIILQAGMPPMGKGRWKRVNEIIDRGMGR